MLKDDKNILKEQLSECTISSKKQETDLSTYCFGDTCNLNDWLV